MFPLLRGFYTAASGMIAQQRQQEALSNNIANANTPGFRADRTPLRAFPEMLMERTGSKQLPIEGSLNLPTSELLGAMNSGVYVQETIPDFTQGSLQQTDIPTDLALSELNVPDEQGGLFFTVENADGDMRFTRNGHFTVEANGFLTTAQGHYVLNETGDRIQTDHQDFTVGENGTVELLTGQTSLGISYVADTFSLRKEGDDLFEGEGGIPPAGATYTVHQGELEQSNVDSGQSMAEMMSSYRLFEANQKVLKAYDESMGRTVSEIGRLG